MITAKFFIGRLSGKKKIVFLGNMRAFKRYSSHTVQLVK